MVADSKEIISHPLIFASDQAFDFTKVDKGNLVIRLSHLPGRLAVDYRNAEGHTTSFHLVYLSGEKKWGLVSLKRKREDEPFSPSPVTTKEQQAEQVNELFKFLKKYPGHVILPTSEQSTQLPQFKHFYYELPHAVQIFDVEGTTALLKAKANLDIPKYHVAIHEAMSSSSQMTSLLIEAKADRLASRALYNAIQYASLGAVQNLIAGKIDVNASFDLPLVTALFASRKFFTLSSDAEKELQIFRLLLDAKADPNAHSNSKDRPIEMALGGHQYRFEHAKLLLQAKAILSPEKCLELCVNFIKSNNCQFIDETNSEGLAVLIEAKAATPSLLSNALKHVLMDPAFLPDFTILSQLVANRADVNVTGFNGETVLHRLTRQSLDTIVEARRMNFGGRQYIRELADKFRRTIPKMVTILLKSKAQALRNADHLTPLQLLKKIPIHEQNREVAEILHQAFIRRECQVSFFCMFHPRSGSQSLGPTAQSRPHFDQQSLRVALDCAGIPTKTRTDRPRK